MKNLLFLLLALILSFSLLAQEVKVTAIEVKKSPTDNSDNSMVIELAIFTDVSKFTFKLDPEKSVFSKIKDNTGHDLLADQMKYEEAMEAKGYGYDKLNIRYRGPIDSSTKPGILVESRLHAAPQKGATQVTIQGVVALINITDKEQTYSLKDIPTQYEWGTPEVKTEMGMVKISESGSVSISDITYNRYRIESDSPISSVMVAGGDDRDKVENVGLEGNELIFQNIPEKLTLTVVATETAISEIPFKVDLTIGF